MDEELVRRLTSAALSKLRAEAAAVGVAVGELVEFDCKGALGDAPVHPRTVFYGASVTKQIIGLLLAQAVADVDINTTDEIARLLPSLPRWTGAGQVRHLIHHTSGLPDLADPNLGIPASNQEVIERFQRHEPRSHPKPGIAFSYNNAGYVILAEALATTIGRPITDAADSDLFTRFDLTDTRLGGPAISLPSIPDPPGTVGDGGLWTSIADLTRWLRACNQNALGSATHSLAETTTRLTGGSELDYAWGLRVTPTPYGRLITHGGSWQTWLAKTARIPERQVAVAVLSVGGDELAVSHTGTELARALASHG